MNAEDIFDRLKIYILIQGLNFMRVFILSLLFLAFALPVHSWAFIDSAADKERQGAPFLIENIMQGKPIRVCLDFNETELDRANRKLKKTPLEGKKRDEYYRIASNEIKKLFASHIQNISSLIENSGRKEEFSDILPYLKSPKIVFVNVPYGSSANPVRCEVYPYDNSDLDLRVMLEVNEELRAYIDRGAAGSSERHYIRIYFHPDYINDNWDLVYHEKYGKIPGFDESASAKKILFSYVMTHELGHVLGLADIYEGGNNVDETYTMDPVIPFYNIKALMNNNSEHLTCDDAEGLMNLIDFYSADSLRKTRGWSSICFKNVVYVKSIPGKVNSEEYQAQIAYAASGYNGPVPTYIKRVVAEQKARVEKYQADTAAQAAAEQAAEAKAKADFQKEEAAKRAEIKRLIETSPVCPVCGESTAVGEPSIIRIAPPRKKITQGSKVWYEYPYGKKCEAFLHRGCRDKYKATGQKYPWNEWCKK